MKFKHYGLGEKIGEERLRRQNRESLICCFFFTGLTDTVWWIRSLQENIELREKQRKDREKELQKRAARMVGERRRVEKGAIRKKMPVMSVRTHVMLCKIFCNGRMPVLSFTKLPPYKI